MYIECQVYYAGNIDNRKEDGESPAPRFYFITPVLTVGLQYLFRISSSRCLRKSSPVMGIFFGTKVSTTYSSPSPCGSLCVLGSWVTGAAFFWKISNNLIHSPPIHQPYHGYFCFYLSLPLVPALPLALALSRLVSVRSTLPASYCPL